MLNVAVFVPDDGGNFPVMRFCAIPGASVFVTNWAFNAVRADDERGKGLVLEWFFHWLFNPVGFCNYSILVAANNARLNP